MLKYKREYNGELGYYWQLALHCTVEWKDAGV